MSDPVDDAVSAALGGNLILMPTDTVYGIGTRPDDRRATAKLFDAKGRARNLELPVLVPSVPDAERIAAFDERARTLAARFWPGALTIVLRRAHGSKGWDLGGDATTIGVRMPHHAIALAVLARTGPLAVTSANRTGQPTPDTCDALAAVFGELVDVYLCQPEPLRGAASTVVSLLDDRPRVLREGSVARDAIEDELGWAAAREPAVTRADARLRPRRMASILVVCTGNICRSPLAEGFLRSALMQRLGTSAPRVRSAGVIGHPGSSAMPESVRAAADRGLDIASHRVRRLTDRDIADADLVIAMAAEHREAICDAVPEASSKTFTLKELVRLLESAPTGVGPPTLAEELLRARVAEADRRRRQGEVGNEHDEDVVDPLGMPYESYRAVAWELDEWTRRLAIALFGASVERSAAVEEG